MRHAMLTIAVFILCTGTVQGAELLVGIGEMGRPVSLVGVNPTTSLAEQDEQIGKLVELANQCRIYGLNLMVVVGPMAFLPSDLEEKRDELIKTLKSKGLTVAVTVHAFHDWGKRFSGHGEADFRWVGKDGSQIDSEYFCMVRSRSKRVPMLESCVRAAAKAGADGVVFDFFDWGPDELAVCYCDECVKRFGSWIGREFNRPQLASALTTDRLLQKQWIEWKASVRNEIAHQIYSSIKKRGAKPDFWLGQFAGGVGTEPRFSSDSFAINFVPAVDSTTASQDDIRRRYEDWKGYMPTGCKVVAVLNSPNRPTRASFKADLGKLADIAIGAGVDGLVLLPGPQIPEEEWKLLKAKAR